MSAAPHDTVRVAVVGAEGRIGRFACGLIDAGEGDAARLELACTVRRGDDLRATLTDHRPAVALDVTWAGLGLEHGLAMLECGVRPVIGTSGVDAEATGQLDARARELGLGGLVVPNFCIGIWLQQRLALEAQRYFPAVEILEEHHADKRDAPSGTAVDTAERLAAAAGDAEVVDGGEVPIHSVRIPGLHSNQTVIFGGPGEVVRITHETYGLEAFGPGIVASLLHAAHAVGVARGVGHALGG